MTCDFLSLAAPDSRAGPLSATPRTTPDQSTRQPPRLVQVSGNDRPDVVKMGLDVHQAPQRLNAFSALTINAGNAAFR